MGKEAGRAGAGEEVGIIACAGAGIGTVVIAGDIYASEYTMGVIWAKVESVVGSIAGVAIALDGMRLLKT